jgi:hypothetical protein
MYVTVFTLVLGLVLAPGIHSKDILIGAPEHILIIVWFEYFRCLFGAIQRETQYANSYSLTPIPFLPFRVRIIARPKTSV